MLLAGTLTAPAQALAPPDDAGGVVTMVPVRILSEAVVTPGTVRCLSVAGEDGIPADATGVVVNVTTVRPDGVGYAVVYPDTGGNGATPMPGTSTVNFEPGHDVAASTFVRLGPNGDLCYATRGGRTGLLLDVSGYVEEGSGVVLAAPQRLLDTREAGRAGMLAPRTVRSLQVAGRLGVPPGLELGTPGAAANVILNVTVTGAESVGNLRVQQGMGGPRPVPTETSVLNYVPGVDKANTTVVSLSSDLEPGTPDGYNGLVELYSDSDRPVHVVVDVLGWTEDDSSYVGLVPYRALDTRVDAPQDGPVAPMEADTVYTLGFDEEEVPADATAVVLNVTAIHPSSTGNLRVYPSDETGELPPPDVSSINYIPHRDIPNLVVVGLSADGLIDVYSDQPEGETVDVAIDVLGYLTD